MWRLLRVKTDTAIFKENDIRYATSTGWIAPDLIRFFMHNLLLL